MRLGKTLLLVFVLALVGCASDADEDRKTKVHACLKLVKAALHHNSDYFPKVVQTLTAGDLNDLQKQFIYKTLLNCYGTVSLIKSADLINRKKHENISPFAKDNKEILRIKSYEEKYKDDKSRLEKDTERLEKALADYEEEYSELVKMAKAAADLYSSDFYKEKNEKVQQERTERAEEEGLGDYEYGNLHLSFITKMDPKIRNGIAIGSLLIIFLSLYWGLNKLTKKEEKVDKKKKKKN